jgi:hypothetical protein
MDENSEVVLDAIDLTNIAVRLVSGTAVIEAVDFNKEWPLKVRSGNLAVEIIKDGIYKFSEGKVTIIEGKLQAADNKIAFKKGWELSLDKTYRAVKVPKGSVTPLENWSRSRSELIARANVNVANSLRQSPNVSGYGWNNAWMFVPGFGAYIFMPGYHFRSPYGYRYRTFVTQNNGGYGGGESSSESGRGGSGGSVSNSGGGSSGGSSGGAAPVPIESRPIGPQIGTDRPSPSLGKPGL